jgi:hypothetical protein
MVDGNIMNERIKELALHSKLRPALLLHYWGKIDALTDSEQEELEQLEKFAELIVRECIETLRLVPYNSDREFGDEVIYQDAVKEHFGIEE